MEAASEARDQIRATSVELLALARAGDREAMNALFERLFPPLRRWAHGRLPAWARALGETTDLVQDALLNTFRRVDRVDAQRRGALQAYLRQAVTNRVRDALRIAGRTPPNAPLDLNSADDRPSPFELAMSAELRARYAAALARLRAEDQALVIGRIDLGYSYEQLALVTGRRSAEAVRVAARRAVVRLTAEMSR